MYIYVYVYICIYIYILPSLIPRFSLGLNLSLSVSVCLCLFVSLWLYLSLSLCLSLSLSVWLSLSNSICLSPPLSLFAQILRVVALCKVCSLRLLCFAKLCVQSDRLLSVASHLKTEATQRVQHIGCSPSKPTNENQRQFIHALLFYGARLTESGKISHTSRRLEALQFAMEINGGMAQ